MVKNILGFGAVPAVLHKVLKRKGITILAYHGVIKEPLPFDDWCFIDEKTFEDQIAYLAKHFRIVHLSEAVKMLDEGRVEEPTAVITFDDGYQNNYDVAFPVLKRYNAPATIYLVSDQIGGEDTIWFCRLNEALSETTETHLSWNGMQFDISSEAGKAYASAEIQRSMKGMKNERLNLEVAKLVLALGGDPQRPVQKDSPYRLMSQEEIAEMQSSGLVEFGAHTCSHAILSRLNAEEQKKEIAGSKRAVEELSGAPCLHFAYPNGGPNDHDPETAKILEQTGFQSCVNMRPGTNLKDTPRMHLHRYGIGTDTSFSRFKLWVHHVA
jgi:peptidoglycan/xylan/chitin deacetylase (PgdA/CDA1 family)